VGVTENDHVLWCCLLEIFAVTLRYADLNTESHAKLDSSNAFKESDCDSVQWYARCSCSNYDAGPRRRAYCDGLPQTCSEPSFFICSLPTAVPYASFAAPVVIDAAVTATPVAVAAALEATPVAVPAALLAVSVQVVPGAAAGRLVEDHSSAATAYLERTGASHRRKDVPSVFCFKGSMSLVARTPEAEAALGSRAPMSRGSAIVQALADNKARPTTTGWVDITNETLGGISALGDVGHVVRVLDEIVQLQGLRNKVKILTWQLVGIYTRRIIDEMNDAIAE